MDKKLYVAVFLLLTIICVDSKKISGSRSSSGSGRGSSRKTSYKPQPAPTSLSYPQPSAPKPTSFGWQESAKKTQTLSSWQSKPSSGQSHSYPSSQIGLSGNNQAKQPPKYQDSVQRSSAPQNLPAQQSQSRNNDQPGHAYPSSNGLSGNSGSGYPQTQGSGYPQTHGSSYPQQGTGLSGAGGPPPPYPGGAPPAYSGGAPSSNLGNKPAYNGGSYPTNTNGNQYYHPQGPPPPYSLGSNSGGYGGHGNFGGHGGYNPGYGPQMPGYFGNYGNNGKGFGGVSRPGMSALTGVGIAGAGVGTILTGLALWNLARSTGHNHHTVVYDNRGQPVAVTPSNDTASSAIDPILADLLNCTLTISTDNATEVLGIPCAIATSFTPDADVKNIDSKNDSKDNTKCTVGVLTKNGKEYTTTIPCSTLLNTAAENNVTEPPLLENLTENANLTIDSVPESMILGQPADFKHISSDVEGKDNISTSCVPEPDIMPDPINPCFSVTHNLTVIPLPPTTPTNMPENK